MLAAGCLPPCLPSRHPGWDGGQSYRLCQVLPGGCKGLCEGHSLLKAHISLPLPSGTKAWLPVGIAPPLNPGSSLSWVWTCHSFSPVCAPQITPAQTASSPTLPFPRGTANLLISFHAIRPPAGAAYQLFSPFSPLLPGFLR